jgi:hypothetical protein
MPFNAEQLAYAGKAAIDFFLKNDPIDQVNTARPLFDKLVSQKKAWTGSLQFVVEQIRTSNDSNFQAYFGDGQVTYNKKRTLNQAKYTWGSFHDGFGLNEDELAQNGIIMTDDRSAKATASEKVQITNIFTENMETLKLGFQEKFDIMLHRDGAQDVEEIAGLDHLISTTPTVGVVGGLDAAVETYWRNFVSLDVTIANLVGVMEDAWRECIRFGGSAPDFILAGEVFIDAYRAAADNTVNRELSVMGRGGANLDAGTGNGTRTGLFFKGVELVWDPVFDDLDVLDAPAQEWTSRAYFINTRFLKLRPIEGHWMISRKPPRVYDRYTNYWATTAKAAMTTGKRNAHAVITATGA